jgi:hypothetical protein
MRNRQLDPHQDRQVDSRRGPQLGSRTTERLLWQFTRTGRYGPILRATCSGVSKAWIFVD